MPYLYLIISVFGIASSGVLGTFYNNKNAGKKDATPLYSLIQLSTIFLFWVIMFLFDGGVEWSVLPYSLIFAAGFAMASISLVYALKQGL